MSSATDKARFYLEKSVPELKEYERKKIFNKVHPTRPPRTEEKKKLADQTTSRMKSARSSRNAPTLSTSSMRAGRNR